ncbi:hypothetical protein Mapa_015420 [Marchantia paleacea]|nr:hypothetical protein Mapa_015420 [Marchantia paleacea]
MLSAAAASFVVVAAAAAVLVDVICSNTPAELAVAAEFVPVVAEPDVVATAANDFADDFAHVRLSRRSHSITN